MRIGEVIGTVTLSQWEQSLEGATWKLVTPLSLDGIQGKKTGRGEPIVVYDELGAGLGSIIAISEGTEAAAPFYPKTKPINAYNAAILDTIDFK